MWEGNKKRGEGKRPNDEQLTTLVHLLCAVLARKSSAMFFAHVFLQQYLHPVQYLKATTCLLANKGFLASLFRFDALLVMMWGFSHVVAWVGNERSCSESALLVNLVLKLVHEEAGIIGTCNCLPGTTTTTACLCTCFFHSF